MTSVIQLVEAFDACFLSRFNTCLVGGADEPLYVPATESRPAVIYFRLDYFSSALHEVSHWCLAGEKRRLLEDYGYWYSPDTRDLETQKEFERVEVKPQAIECVFHWVLDLPFRVSVDNLSLPDYDASAFEQSVLKQVHEFIEKGLPERANSFARFLFKQNDFTHNFEEFLQDKYENHCR
ncbi:elongation factor P hydroxylase [Marinomonas sp. C2222]|uniref:Elongation factor P hydroxylase n=1 Tax=Marinomonas sargassi TaxID=2984494 RepID=A0ABT2YSJ7_9GAMM|nr:elongation factor P hydroxylase [Marinomonas sargassi]MCV2402870.1 elongation factor P hydroxylase [Marinomonas sargassi]